jgi:hypothetical protein
MFGGLSRTQTSQHFYVIKVGFPITLKAKNFGVSNEYRPHTMIIGVSTEKSHSDYNLHRIGCQFYTMDTPIITLHYRHHWNLVYIFYHSKIAWLESNQLISDLAPFPSNGTQAILLWSRWEAWSYHTSKSFCIVKEHLLLISYYTTIILLYRFRVKCQVSVCCMKTTSVFNFIFADWTTVQQTFGTV